MRDARSSAHVRDVTRLRACCVPTLNRKWPCLETRSFSPAASVRIATTSPRRTSASIPERVEWKKYCPRCNKHQVHKETK